jgi:hypothetical protein
VRIEGTRDAGVEDEGGGEVKSSMSAPDGSKVKCMVEAGVESSTGRKGGVEERESSKANLMGCAGVVSVAEGEDVGRKGGKGKSESPKANLMGSAGTWG